MILYIRTDTAIATIGLKSPDQEKGEELQLELGRSMAKELLNHIEQLVEKKAGGWQKLKGVVVFTGPGSFTGLRIGITVANTLAYALSVPVVGESGDDWITTGVGRLSKNEDDRIVLPEYGGEAHITKPRK